MRSRGGRKKYPIIRMGFVTVIIGKEWWLTLDSKTLNCVWYFIIILDFSSSDSPNDATSFSSSGSPKLVMSTWNTFKETEKTERIKKIFTKYFIIITATNGN